MLERRKTLARQAAIGTSVDPVMLEIFNNLFMSIAEQMGSTLEKTSYSVNIKERLDFSCALFDQQGQLIANAPHMPVHLGSMGEMVETVIHANRDATGKSTIMPGDVYVLNAPYNGGTHLPDVTVITPVFSENGLDEGSKVILFYVASRGHHADIGGITPGSMPPDSREVAEEGVLIDNFKLVDQGRFLRGGAARAAGERQVSRRAMPTQNVADMKAQVAANERGVQELRRMVEQFGLAVVHAYMGHVQDNAAEQVRRVIGRLSDGVVRLRDGRRREARGDRHRRPQGAAREDRLHRHLAAAAEQLQRAVRRWPRRRCSTSSARMIDDEIPMNAGCLEPLDIIIPEGSMLRPTYPAAVVAGNVETSQCITDALYGAHEGDGGGAGHDEQLHLRQRAAPVLRDGRRRLRRRAGVRRHRRGADPHDQFAPDRSGGAGVALPGAGGGIPHPPRQRRRRRCIAAATAWCAASASARR